MLAGPFGTKRSVFILLVRSVGAAVPPVWMLAQPAVHCRSHTGDQTHERLRTRIFITPCVFPNLWSWCSGGNVSAAPRLPEVTKAAVQAGPPASAPAGIPRWHPGPRRDKRRALCSPRPPGLSSAWPQSHKPSDGHRAGRLFFQNGLSAALRLILEIHGFLPWRLPISIMTWSSSLGFYGTCVCCVCGNELRWWCLP